MSAPLSETFRLPDPNLLQERASRPDDLVWVSASAGSGKTKVLTDRVLRLLLPDPAGRWAGTAPHRLLCITYTKAAAAEMALRISDSLGRWAVLDEPRLAEELQKLTDQTASPDLIAAARKLFASVLDCPGGLKILTIHSFCQSVLGRFPLEAGVNPDFTVLDEQMAQEMLSEALGDILLEAQSLGDNDLSLAFRRLAVILQLDDLVKNIRAVLEKPELLADYVRKDTSLTSLEDSLKTGLCLQPTITGISLRETVVAQTKEEAVRALALALAQGSKTLQDISSGIIRWLELGPAERGLNIGLYESALLTTAGTPRKLGKFTENEPHQAGIFERECERLLTYRDEVAKLGQCEGTAALMILSHAVWHRYEEAKKRLDALDYNDLIRKTDALLQSSSGKWVHFKLDGGIDHVLMDEAQDTNPYQWSILKHLSSEIFAGESTERQAPRSLFVVGDKKQSIFSFQGADPGSFVRMQDFFIERGREVEREVQIVPLEISFRTVAPVLKLVDTVFDAPELRRQIGLEASQALTHYSFRPQEAGLVELWPLITKPPAVKAESWQLPFILPDDGEAQESLAEQIATQIHFWLQKGETLESQGRAMTAGDILILVRTRTHLVHELVRQLKRRNIPVSGIDRLRLNDQIGVQDLLAAARFARMVDDEFSLACLLKSPLIGWNDDTLMKLALNRTESLWSSLKKSACTDIIFWLEALIKRGHTDDPFEFLESILNQPCPADPEGTGWRAMTARLGHDVIDPLEELLSLSLKLEGQGVRTLEDLILWQQKSDVQIKREMEEAGGQVRIMTVHASKGLEAPVVILPDTVSTPTRASLGKFIWPGTSSLPVPLWAGRSGDACRAYTHAQDQNLEAQRAESARLLYVALTRARDRLYVMGAQGSKTSKTSTWHDLVSDAFNRMDAVQTLENGRKRLVSAQSIPPKDRRKETAGKTEKAAPPAWLMRNPAQESIPARPFIPSRGDDVTQLSPSGAPSPISASHPLRFKRGTITHKLFQFLPDLPQAKRTEAARYYVERAGYDLPAEIRASIVSETLTILNDPVFAAVFGAESLAEVPITGLLPDGRLISGQIDRLVIENESILIVDYKTNRPSPRNAEDIPEIYRQQLRAYHDTLAQIHPKLLIRCAILWTDQPLLMPVAI